MNLDTNIRVLNEISIELLDVLYTGRDRGLVIENGRISGVITNRERRSNE